jgi:CheY-like chemotaxis protein
MDGNVSVESELNKGSTFTIIVHLLKYDPSETEDDFVQDSKEHPLAGRHILMAEDNAVNRMILGSLLKNEGMTYAEASDGEEAVRLFTEAPENTFDCILMDMRMPNVDGIKATMMIRDSGKKDAETVPIIGVSANGFADDINQARKAGVSSYTVKPIDRDKLVEVMTKLIKKN